VKNHPLLAFCGPFALFLIFLGLVDLLDYLGLAHSQYWVYPMQTLVCGGLLIAWRRQYGLTLPRGISFALLLAVLAFGIWIAPQALLGRPARLDGFNPSVFPPGTPAYWITVGFRFLRLVVIVPFVEEIFWRGFLLRYLIQEDFEAVPFGTFSWASFSLVTLFFALEHAPVDYPAAFVTGALFNLVALRTRSLSACVVAHAVTNLLLGGYIMATRQWGFW
jgi:CAAX prenyl protease-like protein